MDQESLPSVKEVFTPRDVLLGENVVKKLTVLGVAMPVYLINSKKTYYDITTGKADGGDGISQIVKQSNESRLIGAIIPSPGGNGKYCYAYVGIEEGGFVFTCDKEKPEFSRAKNDRFECGEEFRLSLHNFVSRPTIIIEEDREPEKYIEALKGGITAELANLDEIKKMRAQTREKMLGFLNSLDQKQGIGE